MTDRPSASAALRAFLFALACVWLINTFSPWIARLGGGALPVSVLLQIVFFGVPTLLYYVRNADMQPALRLRQLDPLCAVLLILSAFVGMMALNWISIYWMQFLSWLGLSVSTGNELAPTTPQQLGLLLLVSAVLPALLEETLFRGFLLPALERTGPLRAAAISGALFAMLHGRLEALPAHLLLGFALALLVLRTGSLFASILFHGAYNASILVVAYLSMTADPVAAQTMPTAAESLASLPMAVALLAIWALLVHTAMQRGQKKQNAPLPPAASAPLSRPARGLLLLSFLLVLLLEGYALMGMLPTLS